MIMVKKKNVFSHVLHLCIYYIYLLLFRLDNAGMLRVENSRSHVQITPHPDLGDTGKDTVMSI